MSRPRASTEAPTKTITVLRLDHEILTLSITELQMSKALNRIRNKFDKEYTTLYLQQKSKQSTRSSEVDLTSSRAFAQLKDGETYRVGKGTQTLHSSKQRNIHHHSVHELFVVQIKGMAPDSPTQHVQTPTMELSDIASSYLQANNMAKEEFEATLRHIDGTIIKESEDLVNNAKLRIEIACKGRRLEQPGSALRNILELTFRALYLYDMKGFQLHMEVYHMKDKIGATKYVFKAIEHALRTNDFKKPSWLQELSLQYSEYGNPDVWDRLASSYETFSDEICHLSNTIALPCFETLATEVMSEASEGQFTCVDGFVQLLIPQPALRHLQRKERDNVRLCIGILGFLGRKGMDIKVVGMIQQLFYQAGDMNVEGLGLVIKPNEWKPLDKQELYGALTKGEYIDKKGALQTTPSLRAYAISRGIKESYCQFPKYDRGRK